MHVTNDPVKSVLHDPYVSGTVSKYVEMTKC